MTEPRLAAFDLDGTLLDSLGDISAALNEALGERFGDAGRLPIETTRGLVGGGARTLVARALAALVAAGMLAPEKAGDAGIDATFALFLARYRARRTVLTRLYPGVREALGGLSRHGVVLAVLTNKPGVLSREILQDLGVLSMFARVIGGDDFDTRKPDPSGLLALMRQVGAPPRSTVLVGDSAIDVRTARAAGARSLGALWGYDRAGLRDATPDALLEAPEALETAVLRSLRDA
jgi:phosphoglycolate phosphatase